MGRSYVRHSLTFAAVREAVTVSPLSRGLSILVPRDLARERVERSNAHELVVVSGRSTLLISLAFARECANEQPGSISFNVPTPRSPVVGGSGCGSPVTYHAHALRAQSDPKTIDSYFVLVAAPVACRWVAVRIAFENPLAARSGANAGQILIVRLPIAAPSPTANRVSYSN